MKRVTPTTVTSNGESTRIRSYISIIEYTLIVTDQQSKENRQEGKNKRRSRDFPDYRGGLVRIMNKVIQTVLWTKLDESTSTNV